MPRRQSNLLTKPLNDIKRELIYGRVLTGAILILTLLLFVFTGILVAAALSFSSHPLITGLAVIVILLVTLYLLNKNKSMLSVLPIAREILKLGASSGVPRQRRQQGNVPSTSTNFFKIFVSNTLGIMFATAIATVLGVLMANYSQTGYFIPPSLLTIHCEHYNTTFQNNGTRVFGTQMEIRDVGATRVDFLGIDIVATKSNFYQPTNAPINGRMPINISDNVQDNYIPIQSTGTIYEGDYVFITLFTFQPSPILIQNLYTNVPYQISNSTNSNTFTPTQNSPNMIC